MAAATSGVITTRVVVFSQQLASPACSALHDPITEQQRYPCMSPQTQELSRRWNGTTQQTSRHQSGNESPGRQAGRALPLSASEDVHVPTASSRPRRVCMWPRWPGPLSCTQPDTVSLSLSLSEPCYHQFSSSVTDGHDPHGKYV